MDNRKQKSYRKLGGKKFTKGIADIIERRPAEILQTVPPLIAREGEPAILRIRFYKYNFPQVSQVLTGLVEKPLPQKYTPKIEGNSMTFEFKFSTKDAAEAAQIALRGLLRGEGKSIGSNIQF